MSRRRLRTAVAAAAILALAAAVTALALRDHGSPRNDRGSARKAALPSPHAKSYAELVAANYKVLKPKQTRRLLRFAEAIHACMAKRIALGPPRPLPTRIVMALPANAVLQHVAELGLQCGTKLGDPPKDASLQTRKHAVVLYLPKYCILDRKVATAP
jgi:hypothetical protein